MKLKKFLKTKLDAGTIVCIGAQKGSGYVVYADCTDLERIDGAFKDFKKRKENILEKEETTLRNMIKNMDFKKSYAMLKKYDPYITEDEAVFTIAANVSKSRQSIISNKRYLETFIDILDREVVDSYIRENDDIECVAVIVKGTEEGKLWFKHDETN